MIACFSGGRVSRSDDRIFFLSVVACLPFPPPCVCAFYEGEEKGSGEKTQAGAEPTV